MRTRGAGAKNRGIHKALSGRATGQEYNGSTICGRTAHPLSGISDWEALTSDRDRWKALMEATVGLQTLKSQRSKKLVPIKYPNTVNLKSA